MKYSQNDEQDYILDHFKDISDGRLLDIGAYDGKTFSNSLALIEKGWRAVLVEPSPSVLPALWKLHEGNNNVFIVSKAVSDHDGIARFYDSDGDALSSLNPEHKKKWHTTNFRDIQVDIISMNSLLTKHGYDFDFINIDVESNNMQLLQLLPFNKLTNLKCLCIEHDSRVRSVLSTVEQFGFKEVYRNAENIIVVK